MAATRIIVLTGAPETESLKWNESDLTARPDLCSETNPPSHRSLHAKSSALSPPSKWRSLSLARNSAPIPALVHEAFEATQFLSYNYTNPTDAPGQDDQADFLEDSIAALDDVDSSNLVQPTTELDPDINFDDNTTQISTANMSFNSSNISDEVLAAEPSGPLRSVDNFTNLRHIPPASNILSLHPQTLTVNLIAGIVAISPTHSVTLRRRSGEMDIVEVTIGDETKAGFCVNFWLTPEDSQPNNRSSPLASLRAALTELKSGDVVAMRNVALSTFRGSVYGQSLPGSRFGRIGTTVHKLAADMATVEETQHPRTIEKVRRVLSWVHDFVGIAKDSGVVHGRSGGKQKAEELPPDTQD